MRLKLTKLKQFKFLIIRYKRRHKTYYVGYTYTSPKHILPLLPLNQPTLNNLSKKRPNATFMLIFRPRNIFITLTINNNNPLYCTSIKRFRPYNTLPPKSFRPFYHWYLMLKHMWYYYWPYRKTSINIKFKNFHPQVARFITTLFYKMTYNQKHPSHLNQLDQYIPISYGYYTYKKWPRRRRRLQRRSRAGSVA